MAADQYRSLSPDAILATLRSLPRRYREAVTGDPPMAPATAAAAAGLIVTAANRVSAVADAVHRAAVLEHPTVAIDAAPAASAGSIDAALAALDAAAAHGAQVIAALPASAWERSATVDGSPRTVLELAQGCAREGVEALRRLTLLAGRHA